MEKCPIQRFSRKLLKEKVTTRKELEAIDLEINAAIDAAVEFAAQSDFPDPDEMYEDVYVSEVNAQ